MADALTLDAFLADPPPTSGPTGGRRCTTCLHPQATALNADMRSFIARRHYHPDEEGFTAYPWRGFVKRYLRDRYGDHLPKEDSSIRRHAEKCLDLEVPA